MMLETDYKKIDWVGVKNDFLEKMRMLQIIWQASQKKLEPEQHAMMVEKVYLPSLTKVAEFCASIEVTEEDKANYLKLVERLDGKD